ncbi:MAG: MoxR family ATPase [Deltaproteobacteria bacterium]|nr:MoxR family ATPase [Deltaproteobacteria bacterium]MBM4297849.1 MoxR family ATPase [Deltaproteobacteria bacterium]
MESVQDIESRMERARAAFDQVKAELARVIVGHEELIEQVFIALVCGGHCLLEGVPGLGKTLMVRSLGEILSLSFSRVQFTPDLMPADITGTNVLTDDPSGRKVFEFQRGPVFAHIVLADEINRATPKTQSALLEAMQEQSVTVGGKVHRLENPFMVLATQNPIEMEGTYPLPEAQVDRFFFKLLLQYPSREELSRIADLTTAAAPAALREVLDGATILAMRQWVRDVPIAEVVKDYAVRLVLATHALQSNGNGVNGAAQKYVQYGSSPRGLQSTILAAKARALFAGRPNVSFDDIRIMLLPSLRHRLILNLEADAEGVNAEKILGEVIEQTKEVE